VTRIVTPISCFEARSGGSSRNTKSQESMVPAPYPSPQAVAKKSAARGEPKTAASLRWSGRDEASSAEWREMEEVELRRFGGGRPRAPVREDLETLVLLLIPPPTEAEKAPPGESGRVEEAAVGGA